MLFLLRELLVVFIVCPESCHPSSESASVMSPGLLNYTWDQLLLLRPTCTPAPQLPSELLAQRPEWGCRRWMWKRWKRGRVQQRLQKRANRPRLPSILLCNVQSLKIRDEELRVKARFPRVPGVILARVHWDFAAGGHARLACYPGSSHWSALIGTWHLCAHQQPVVLAVQYERDGP